MWAKQFYTPANNVVRVAPRQKNATTTTSATASSSTLQAPPSSYCYNLAHSFPSSNSNSSTNTATNLSTYPNFLHINSSNNSTATTTTAFAGIAQQQQQQKQQHKTKSNFNSSQVPADSNNTIVDNDPIKSTAVLNPFLAKRPKSLNQVKRNLVRPPPPPPPPSSTSIASSSSQHHTVSFSSLSMPQTKSIEMHCTMADKKFNSLKSVSARKTPQFYSLRLNKCRRHQAALTNPTYNTQQKLLVINNSSMPYLHSSKSHHSDSDAESTSILRKLTFNQQPLYENLVNASLEHGENILAGSTCLDEFYCEANDVNSIYRSDSGISNSSYELTPVPAPRNNPRNCQSAPVYMNLPKYASICGTGTNSKYRTENNIPTTPNSKLGFKTTAFNYEVCVCAFPNNFCPHFFLIFHIHLTFFI